MLVRSFDTVLSVISMSPLLYTFVLSPRYRQDNTLYCLLAWLAIPQLEIFNFAFSFIVKLVLYKDIIFWAQTPCPVPFVILNSPSCIVILESPLKLERVASNAAFPNGDISKFIILFIP